MKIRQQHLILLVIALIGLGVISISFLRPSSNAQTAQSTQAAIPHAITIEQPPLATEPVMSSSQKWQQQLALQDKQAEKQQENASQRPSKAPPRPEPEHAIKALSDSEEFNKQQAAYDAQRQAMLDQALAAAKAANYHGQPDELPNNNPNQRNTP